MHLHYDVKASKHLASLLTTDRQRERQAGCVAVSLHLDYLYFIFSCCQLPFCDFPKHTTPLHYRYDIQMYCTFVLSVNQHFPGLPASGTYCISVFDQMRRPIRDYNETKHIERTPIYLSLIFLAEQILLNLFCESDNVFHLVLRERPQMYNYIVSKKLYRFYFIFFL
jgi:hypothetical protein